MTKFMHVGRTPFSTAQKPNVRRFSIQKAYLFEYATKLLPPVARSMYYFSRVYLPYEYNLLLGILPNCCQDRILHGFFSRFNLLRILAIFEKYKTFDSFPLVITELFHLRYLQLPFDGNIPESISELQNLQTLINDGSSCKNTSCGKTIWMMKKLRYIRFREPIYIPSPRIGSSPNKNLVTVMPNLEEIFGLSHTSCTNEVFSGVPNLKILIIRVPYNKEYERFPSHLTDMSCLRKLEAINFHLTFPFKNPIKQFVFPTSLRRLSLSWCYFIWEDISSTSIMLPNLEELKLKRCLADDDVWRLSDKEEFKSLKLLSLYFISLKLWEASSDNFPNLKRLVLKELKDLQEIPTDFGEICTLESIELHDCSTTADDSARKIKQEQDNMGNNVLKVYISNTRRN